jgi:hypothetical protein
MSQNPVFRELTSRENMAGVGIRQAITCTETE